VFDLAAITALPDVMLRADEFPRDRRPRLVATGYGGSVRESISGSSAFLADAGIRTGALDGAFTLYSTEKIDRLLQVRGAIWKAQRIMRRERPGGFKYAPQFSNHLWHRHLSALAGTDIISNFQLFSEEVFQRRSDVGIRAFFYLDGTLHDYLRGYREYDVADIDPSTADRVMDLERHGYERADGLAVWSEFAARTLESEYGIARDRIRVLTPGANLHDEMAEQVITARHSRPSQEFTVGFIGVYPERKGLPKLADAIALLRREGVPVRLQVVGRCPDQIAAMDGVDALGHISKTAEPDRFIAAMARIDLGAQLSTAELFGIAVLEYIRCGIPVIATDIGGVSDVLHAGASIDLPSDVGIDAIAAAIERVVTDGDERRRLTAAATARGPALRWELTADALGNWVDAADPG
jgi:glycosyltransferase involved in cell wall biosynthesis